MNLDLQPTAQATYRRTLIERGCPPNLAAAAAEVLASDTPELQRIASEQALIDRAGQQSQIKSVMPSAPRGVGAVPI